MLNKTMFLLCLVLGATSAPAADVVYIVGANSPSVRSPQLDDTVKFFGLELQTVMVRDARDQARVLLAMRKADVLAVIVDASALGLIKKDAVFKVLATRGGEVPLLISGIVPGDSGAALAEWSDGTLSTAETVKTSTGSFYLKVGRDPGVTQQLSGMTVPLKITTVPYLSITRNVQPIISAVVGTNEYPLLIVKKTKRQEVFFAANIVDDNSAPGLRPITKFASVAPYVLFLHYVGNERVWHYSQHFANFTVDDAWLREPYGHMSYRALLSEMKAHNFHTTIAFVPWNFDRSQSAVVSLLQANKERFSICVHGNNHNGREFGPYSSRSLAQQTNNVAQALARMERFNQLTGLDFDRVMVFPHLIAPEPTLAVLKRDNFLATVNSSNVPEGEQPNVDLYSDLRPATTSFANFLSVRRYSAEVPIAKAELALDAFLGNPIFFYAHEGFFAEGNGAFDRLADEVNQLQPDTQWRGLGDIARHLYLEKVRSDGNYDILALSRVIRLENKDSRDETFFIRKEEDFTLPFQIKVDGESYPYERRTKEVFVKIQVPAGATRQLSLIYDAGLTSSVDIAKSSLKIATIRRLSDFRDNVVSKTSLGLKLLRWHHDHEAESDRLIANVGLVLTLAAILAIILALKSVLRSPRMDTSKRARAQ